MSNYTSISAEKPNATTSKGTGRMPTKPSPLLQGPLKRCSSNYQLYRTKEYLDESFAIISEVAKEYPDLTTRPEFDHLTRSNKLAFDEYANLTKPDHWESRSARTAKIQARVQRKEAKRTSDRAIAEKIRSLARPIPEDDAASIPRSDSPSVGVNFGLFEGVTPSDQNPMLPNVDPNNGRVFGNQPLVPADPSDDTVSESEMVDDASETIPLIPLSQVTVEPVTA